MQERQISANLVTWQQAEDALTAAVEYLFRLPDAESAFLRAGSRSCWPQIVRSVRAGDYGDGQGEQADPTPPSPQLTRRMVALVEAMLTGERRAADAVPEGHRSLVMRVIVIQRWPGPDEFNWSRIWQAEKGVLFNHVRGELLPTTSDAMRKAYERAIGKLAQRMTAMGIGLVAEAA